MTHFLFLGGVPLVVFTNMLYNKHLHQSHCLMSVQAIFSLDRSKMYFSLGLILKPVRETTR